LKQKEEVKEEVAKESWRMELERTFVRMGARLLILCLSFGKTGAPSYWLGPTSVQRLKKRTEKRNRHLKDELITWTLHLVTIWQWISKYNSLPLVVGIPAENEDL
jgi:hypothetical protein